MPAAAEMRTGVVMSEGPWLERTVLLGASRKRATHGPLLVYLPYEGSSNKPWIRAVVGKGVPIKPITHRHLKVWELSAGHLLPLAAAMADRYGEVEMRLQVSPTMKCSHSCQTAYAYTVWECVCECGGRHHSGEGTYDDWYSTGRFRIERQGDIEVRHIQIRRGQIPLPPKSRPLLSNEPCPNPRHRSHWYSAPLIVRPHPCWASVPPSGSSEPAPTPYNRRRGHMSYLNHRRCQLRPRHPGRPLRRLPDGHPPTYLAPCPNRHYRLRLRNHTSQDGLGR